MFDELKSKYNLNRKAIWSVVGIIVAIIIISRIFNGIAKKQIELPKDKSAENQSISHAVISGSKVKKDVQEKTTKIIDSFMEKCNNGDYSSAYSLLSKDCKEKTYTSQESFEKVFIAGNFETKKEYSIQAWIKNTYKVKIYEDMLETGKSITENLTIENYMTVVDENGSDKLNINGYVETKDVEGEMEKDKIKVEVQEKDVYVDFEIYKVKVTNTTDNDIIMDTKEQNGTVYLTNNRGTMFPTYSNEMEKSAITVDKGTYKILELKFANNYKTDKKIESMTFSKVQLNMEDITNVTNIKVEIK